MAPFIHELSDVQSSTIGDETRIWQYTVVLASAKIGEQCNICSHCFVENDVEIGNRVTVKCGVQIWDGLRIEDDVFIGPNVTFTNDPFPRSKQYPKFSNTVIKQGASIGANATILPGITIGQGAMIGAGSVVTSDVPPGTIVAGNPARVLRYVAEDMAAAPAETMTKSLMSGADLFSPVCVNDVRGELSVVEWSKHLSFVPQRVFFVHHVPNQKVRGQHAHKECHQALVCISGSVTVVVDDGQNRQEILLDSARQGLHIHPGIWAVQYRYSQDAVLAVLASQEYDENDYIRDYEEFLAWKAGKSK